MRASPLIEYSSTVLILCLWIGAFTTVFSSLIGLFQQDIKKVIAYSTMSQLARECINIINTFKHQTIYEKIIFKIYFIFLAVKLLVVYSYLFFHIKVINLEDKGAKNIFKYIYQENINSQRFVGRPQPVVRLQATFSHNYTTLTSPTTPASLAPVEFNTKLDPYYITGFVDGQGCFLINIDSKSDRKLGYAVSLSFKLKLDLRDKEILEKFIDFFKVGNITIRKDEYIEYIISSIKDIEVIIHYFDTYPLISQKWSDYQLFKRTFELIKCKEHLTVEGLQKALSFKAVLNNGLSDELKFAFPNLIPVIRPKVTYITPRIKNPYWLSGFVDAEVCFFVSLTNNYTGIGLIFKVTQHRDTYLLKEFLSYFNCGRNSLCSSKAGDYIVTKFSSINNNILPFFNKYPVLGSKSLDFSDLKKVAAELIENKVHLTPEGFKFIKEIKSGMNKGRLYNKLDLSRISSNNVTPSSNYLKKTSFSPLIKKLNYSTVPSKARINKVYPNKNSAFNEWLSGLIDGKGQFFVSKKDYANFRITIPLKDKFILYEIKHKYGGSIKSVSGSNSLKYKLHHKKGLINLIDSINGLIRNPSRMLELNKVCQLYNIELKIPQPITYNNGWFSGFVDANGYINIDEPKGQLVLGVTQKNRYILDFLQNLYMGKIDILSSKQAFQYYIYRKKDILLLVDNYFNKYPLKSAKSYKLNLIKDFYLHIENKNLQAPHQIDKFNEWIKFKNKWDKL